MTHTENLIWFFHCQERVTLRESIVNADAAYMQRSKIHPSLFWNESQSAYSEVKKEGQRI